MGSWDTQMEGRPTQVDIAALRVVVYCFLLKALGNRAEADDLTQETLTLALQALPGFRGECRLSTWLLGIALNVMRNHSRLARHRIEVNAPDALANMAGDDDPARRLLRDRDLLQLRRAIDGLPAEFRDAILLVSIQELSYEEAAAALRVPVGTVRSRLSRGRALLRERLLALDTPSQAASLAAQRSEP